LFAPPYKNSWLRAWVELRYHFKKLKVFRQFYLTWLSKTIQRGFQSKIIEHREVFLLFRVSSDIVMTKISARIKKIISV